MRLEGGGLGPLTDFEGVGIFHQTPCPQHPVIIRKGTLRGEKQVYVGVSRGRGV